MRSGFVCCCVSFLVSTAAVAADGELEINQACAVSSGCFPGDAPGFPVTIGARGSYRLTSDLDLSGQNANTSAISINAQFVTLDLAGFAVHGPVSCSGTPTTSCAPLGTGVGVAGVSFLTVKNGIVSGFASDGVRLQHGVRIEDIQSIANGGSGVVAGDQSEMRWIEATLNRLFGIQANIEATLDHVSAVGNGGVGLSVASGVLTDNNASRNGSFGASLGTTTAFSGNHFASNVGGSVIGGKATGGNVCDDGKCSRAVVRRYYETGGSADGAHATTACAAGFHMASIWEIRDTSNLAYDTSLGLSFADSGAGPPASDGSIEPGWIRTGGPAAPGVGTLASAGSDNCNAWTSTSGFGTYAVPATGWAITGGRLQSMVAPWSGGSLTCSFALPVWCVED